MYYDWTEKDTGTLKGWGGDNMPAAFYRYKGDIFYYDAEGVPTFAGCINSSGTAYPLTEYGDRIYTGGHHFVRVYTFQAGRIVIDEEAYAVYDSDGKATYYVLPDTHDTGAGEDGLVDDGTRLDEMFTEFMQGQTIEFSVVG